MKKLRDKQYWTDKLNNATMAIKILQFEIKLIEWKLNHMHKIPQHYRWAGFGRLTKLRRKLHTLKITKIPFYEGMINNPEWHFVDKWLVDFWG